MTNTGSVTLTGVTVSDTITAMSGGRCPRSLPARIDTTTFTAAYVLTQADLDNNGGGDGDIDNTATATGTPPAGPDVTGVGSDATAIAVIASIGIVKDSTFADENGDGYAQVGETINIGFQCRLGTVHINRRDSGDPLITVVRRPVSFACAGCRRFDNVHRQLRCDGG